MYKIVQYTFYPFIVLTAVGLTVLAIHSVDRIYLTFIPGILSIAFSLLFIFCEHSMPYRLVWKETQGDFLADILQTFVTLPLAYRLTEVSIPVLILYFSTEYTRVFNSESFFAANDLLLNAAMVLIVCEFFYYWVHRLSHTIPTLWKLHSVHHGAPRVYWANSGRFHFLDALLGAFAYMLPIFILGVPMEVSIVVISILAITGFMEHTNIDFRTGILNYLFNTAEHHRWHHSEVLDESNKNFGKVLIVWDLIFGTYYLPNNKEVQEVGIKDEKVPVSFIGQLKYPFQKN
ncbi:MAG: hypothetical protein CL840_07050 [Crocinitomicaceae bacterium]|nr:hypothetical protein [Crocinitomicaceae bacterium]|tara:strand:+ start:1492 stop:2358 length:867 start_codon:yes stop_codon:yes gene_type:complete